MNDERRQCLLKMISFFVPYGESGQDRFVYEKLIRPNGKKGYIGTFLDVGCNDYRWNNNSYGLETFFGWKGLLVDNDPVMVQLCRATRKNPVIEGDAVSVDWLGECKEHDIGMDIDYLSLDVDDFLHCAILENFIKLGFSFKIITVEHDRYVNGDEPRNSIRKVLFGAGYILSRPDVRCPAGGEYEDWWTNAKI
jgi:hypothetical protein